MKTHLSLFLSAFLMLGSISLFAQEDDYQIHTLINSRAKASGAYGAITNKFTEINGKFANLVEIYGGWYINHRVLLGLELAAATNNITVPLDLRTLPDERMSYAYGQFGLMTEYVVWSHRAIHPTFHLMTGAGFTAQYIRSGNAADEYWDDHRSYSHDTRWFGVVEPGVKIEMNILKWMRFSPGVSYRAIYLGEENNISRNDLDGISLNLSLKFGKF